MCLLYIIYVLIDTKWCLGSINTVKQSMKVLFKEENDELFSITLLKTTMHEHGVCDNTLKFNINVYIFVYSSIRC